MKRKPIYIALGSVFAVIAILLLVMPGETRSMFFWEFKQNVAEMLGYEAEAIEGEDGKEGGLRSESPEEYGPGAEEHDTEGSDVESETPPGLSDGASADPSDPADGPEADAANEGAAETE